MNFANGDRVKVVTDRWDTASYIQHDKVGTVSGVVNGAFTRWWRVTLDERPNTAYNYEDQDIELLWKSSSMPDPEMDLDEIHLAQKLMGG